MLLLAVGHFARPEKVVRYIKMSEGGIFVVINPFRRDNGFRRRFSAPISYSLNMPRFLNAI
jgi:hypothetical protein